MKPPHGATFVSPARFNAQDPLETFENDLSGEWLKVQEADSAARPPSPPLVLNHSQKGQGPGLVS